VKPAKFEYERPSTVDEATNLLADEGQFNRVLAGGQSLGPMLNLRLAQPERLIDITNIPELKRADRDGDYLTLGACVTHSQLEDGAAEGFANGMLESVAHGISCRAVRNRGTIGGSVAHADPAADWPVALLALGAEVTIARPDNQRHLPLANFLFAPFETALKSGELLSAVHIPVLSNSARWGYYKFCRKLGEFAETMAAVLFDPDRGISRAVIGATEARPTIIDAEFTNDTATAMIEENFPDADWYQRQLHSVALRRALNQIQQ
jgi:carbon-monoxide dehydrogenase medium subunit